jgi:SAM-dependent methyltransferase
MTRAVAHWDNVYTSRVHQTVSWFQELPRLSLLLIERAAPLPAAVLDVGGGASCLGDRLLDIGYTVGVLDISEKPLRIAQDRLGERQAEIEWIVADIQTFQPARAWDVWHDRAVFHFLVDAHNRAAYLASLRAATHRGSSVIIATFGPDGPKRCSGLPICRYTPEKLADQLGPSYELREVEWENHRTPAGVTQQFVYCRFRRTE